MERVEQTVSDLGELRLLREYFLPDVQVSDESIGDDCATLSLGNSDLLWSIDPCPTPVAHWFGKASAEVWGHYTATINLSDISASGGRPLGMLTSIEMPGETPLKFVQGFQRGLMSCLRQANVKLLGGNVKSARTFSATGTIIGRPGKKVVSRYIGAKDCAIYLVGPCCKFWAAVVGNYYGWKNLPIESQHGLDQALCYPTAQVRPGAVIGDLPFPIACMDCSDGAANAIYQLAEVNQVNVTLFDSPRWASSDDALSLLSAHSISLENAGYGFGDWQLACFIPNESADHFEEVMAEFPLTTMGFTTAGNGTVVTESGRMLQPSSLNQNFLGGYNSVDTIEALIEKFLVTPLFR